VRIVGVAFGEDLAEPATQVAARRVVVRPTMEPYGAIIRAQ
jgi:hypothetical protein